MARRWTEKEIASMIKLRQDTGRGSDYLYGLIFKDPEKYGFSAGRIPSVGTIQRFLSDAGLIKSTGARTHLGKMGDVSHLETPFGALVVNVSRKGVEVSDGTKVVLFFGEDK